MHRVRGDLGDAEAAYERANAHGCQPQPGLAQLRVDQGQVDAAAGAIRRALSEAEDPISRARLLGPAVEVLLADGDLIAAQRGAEELTEIAGELASPLLAAYAAHASGATRLAAGDATSALPALRRAWATWADLDAPYEGARTGLLLAEACGAVGDRDGAALERRAAEAALERLGAPPAASQPSSGVEAAAGLSSRETEVLRLVAKGKSNRDIAAELFIAEKTVASHLSHIFAKVGVTSRTAATAFAYEHGVVPRSR